MRSGVTLLEVLVAIFVMGIGLLALLTLFPLGAMRMAQAIKDERSAQAAVNARAISQAKNIRCDPSVEPKLKNPNVGAGHLDADDDKPSYPVFIDPRGYFLGNNKLGSNIARVSPSFIVDNTKPEYFHFCHLLDDVTFQRNFGAPKVFGSTLAREFLYTWAFLVQRPRLGEKTITNCMACIFQRRPNSGTLDTAYPANFSPSDNTIQIGYTGSAPNIQPGQWVLDGTLKTKYAHGFFYRITGARDDAVNKKLILEVQTPLLGHASTTAGEAIILDGLVEVFDLGLGR